jgi:hypothetical protein
MYFTHPEHSHVVMTEPEDPDVDRAFFAFDKAKLAFSKGAPGPFQLDGHYTGAVYDRFRGLSEAHWKVAFSRGLQHHILLWRYVVAT